MAGTHRFQNVALRANPCIISTGVESTHGHRKSSTMQWTLAPSARAMRGISELLRNPTQITKALKGQNMEDGISCLRILACRSRCVFQPLKSSADDHPQRLAPQWCGPTQA